MSDPARDRPRQLTMALWLVVMASAFQVLLVFDRMTTLNSLTTRQEVSRVVRSTSGKELGLSIDEALAGMRIALTVLALCAACAVVLGVFALQRHRAARVGLTVLAVPMLILAPLTAPLVGLLVAASVACAWTGQARDWFAGRAVRERRRPPARRRATPPPAPPESPPTGPPAPPPTLSTDETSAAPRPTSGFGSAPVRTPILDRPRATTQPPPAYAVATAPSRAPSSVRFACALTWLFAGVVALLYAVLLVVLVVDRGWVVQQIVASPAWDQTHLRREVLVPVLWIGCLLFLGWTASAVVLAVFVWRRHNWARYLLMASAAAAILVGFFAFPVGVFHQMACAYVIWGLFTPAARQWFALPPSGPGPPAPGGPSPAEPAGRDKPPVW